MNALQPVPGDVIDAYEILENIGGNMGLVFKARHRLLDKLVALKLLPVDSITDSTRLARFQKEMWAMGRLEHPNLVTAADARTVDSWHLVAMEWIDGLDLQQLVRTRGKLPINVACEAARQAALGLHYAHEHGLIHRDIKPSNLMLTRTGTIKVIDMGLALIEEDSSTQLTQAGQVMGTMSYCAPEQLQNASSVDIRADIYSLGCTLYHLLAGKAPYSQRKSLTEVVQAHLNEPLPSLAEARPDAPAGLEAVLARMTAKNPASRFATPQEVAEALEPFARGADLKEFVPAKVEQGRPARGSAGKAFPSREARRSVGSSEQQPKARWAWRAALVMLALAGAVFIALSFRAGTPVSAMTKPVLVLTDTTAKNGVYDEENRNEGLNNATELSKVLEAGGMPPLSLNPEPLHADWDREQHVIALRPDLVIMHRSAFFHSANATFGFGATNEFKNPMDDPRAQKLFEMSDDRLITMLGLIGNEVPQTRFLIYSRGTDPKWLSDDFRAEWVRKVEHRCPKLKGRVFTMVIPNGYSGTFRDPKTADELRRHVREILKLPEKAK